MKTILVTGGAGYIGSHTCVELLNNGYEVVIIDNFSNSSPKAVDAIAKITGVTPILIEGDVCDKEILDAVFSSYSFDAVIHFAGYKAVGESTELPLMYYSNNLNSTINLLYCMEKYNVNKIIFSSSATVYGSPEEVPIKETAKTYCTNPYGWTKYMSEQIIRDYCYSHPDATAVLLRYFNPVGAHESGTLGESPKGRPNNLMPRLLNVAVGKTEHLGVFGDDYNTHDGTGVRDYIHVVDLAKGHIKAINYDEKGCIAINLGTGIGYSVLDLIHAFENSTGVKIPYVISARRPGDIDCCYADPTLAKELLDWSAELDVEAMCKSSYHWITLNPNGYED